CVLPFVRQPESLLRLRQSRSPTFWRTLPLKRLQRLPRIEQELRKRNSWMGTRSRHSPSEVRIPDERFVAGPCRTSTSRISLLLLRLSFLYSFSSKESMKKHRSSGRGHFAVIILVASFASQQAIVGSEAAPL